MANSYFIKIELPPDDKKSAVAGTGAGSTGESDSSDSGSSSETKVVNKLKSLVSFAAIKSTADTIINNDINQISLRTGATEYEQRQSYIYNTASSVVGAGASLVIGGIMGGPAGVAVAAIGIAVTGIKKIADIEYKRENLMLQESLENISLGMAQTRAGYSGRREKNQ